MDLLLENLQDTKLNSFIIGFHQNFSEDKVLFKIQHIDKGNNISKRPSYFQIIIKLMQKKGNK